MKSFKETVYFGREKEENWDIQRKAEKLGFENSRNLVYLGCDVGFEIEVKEDFKHKVLKIEGIDVSDKEIYI